MIALYPGTFDPITNGHFEIIRRASTIFQVLVVGVAVSEEKEPLFDHEKRLEMVNEVLNAFCRTITGRGHPASAGMTTVLLPPKM